MLRVRALEWPPTLVEGMVRDVDAAGTDAELARSRAPAASGWAAELKWDGFRALVSVDARKAVLRSRRGTEMGPGVSGDRGRCGAAAGHYRSGRSYVTCAGTE